MQHQSSIRRWVYLLLALAGAILPWQANLEFLQTHPGGFDLLAFIL